MVDAEDHTCAEKRLVCEIEGGVVVVGFVPEALAGDADALAGNLANNGLHHDFVRGDRKLLNLSLNLAHDILNPCLGLGLVVFFIGNVLSDHVLNNDLHLVGVESITTN